MNRPKLQNQKILDRLMLDHAFQKIRENAKNDRDNLNSYVIQARKQFKLSPYWDGILSWLLTYDGLIEKIPMTGGIVDTRKDMVTGKDYYYIPVFPETTDANIRSSAKLIRERYKERGETIDIRMSDADKTLAEFRALALQEAGSSNAEILEVLNDEFAQAYIINDIPLMIRSAKNKSLRQENGS